MIDLDAIRSTLRDHAVHLQDELQRTERAIEVLGQVDAPVLFLLDEAS